MLNSDSKELQTPAPSQVDYDFYDCEICNRGFSVEDTPDDRVADPNCPACQCNAVRYVGTVKLTIPLSVTYIEEKEID